MILPYSDKGIEFNFRFGRSREKKKADLKLKKMTKLQVFISFQEKD